MAGIISNVDSDVQKLRKLKNEIENVKKALMGINIKVDIDIAKGLQSQLTSLLGQYDTLVDKIAAAEGKIMLSTSRINKATEKIVQAQEQVSKPVVIPTQTGNANVQTNTTETASIQAQAKAYDELAAEINKVLGTREENIRKLIEESNAIKLNKNLIKQTEKDYTNSSGVISEKGVRLLEVYNSNLLRHKAALSEIRQVLINEEKLYNASENSMARLSQELSRMRIAYRAMTDEAKSSPFGQELLATIEQADAKIKSLDATIGNHQRNIGNYAKGYNGLNMSIQQIVRELPAATMGLNMLFLAISNNLPILTDEIKRVKAANEELKKSGQTGVPVWKQLVSSLFSWQSAMMIGITVMSMYGGEIIEWVKSIFKGKDVLDEVTESQEEMTKRLEEEQRTRKSAAQSVASLLTEYKKLQKEYEALDGNTQRQNKFIKEHKTEFQKLGVAVNDVTDAENLFVKNETAFITSLQHRAMAAAAMAQMETEYKKVIDRMVEMEDYIAAGGNQESRNMAQNLTDSYIASLLKQKGVINSMQSAYPYIDLIKQGKWQSNRDLQGTGTDWAKEYNAYYQNQLSMLVGAEAADRFNRRTEESQKKIESLTKVVRKESTAAKDSLNEAGLKEYEKEAENQLKQQEQLAEQLLSLRRKNQQDEINLMADGTEKKLAQIDLDYQKELDAIKKQRKDWETAQGGKLTDKQEAKLGTWASNAAKKRESDIDSTSKAKLEADKKAWQEYFIEFGNYQEKRKNLIQKYDDEIAKLQSDSPEYAIKVAEKNQAVEQLDEQYGRTTRAMADLFEDASNKSVSAIQDIIDKYEALIEYMSGTDKDISIADLKGIGFTDKDIEKIEKGEISIKDVTDAIRGLKDELKGKSPWQAFVSDLEKGIEAIKKGGSDSKKVGQGITDIGNAVTSFAPALGEFGSNIANIFGVSDSAITGATDALGGFGTTAIGVGQIMSGDIVGGAMSAVSGISSVVSAFEGLFGADYSDYENMKAQYETLIAIWDELITKKMDYIDIDYGTEAIKAAEEAEQLVNIQISRQRQLIKQLASSGASAGSHSLGYRINDRLSKEDYQRISGLVGQKITAEYQLWDLSSEQIEKILSDEKLVSVLDTVNKDFVTYLQNIVDYGEQLTEIAQKEKEAITGIGFDEFKNGYADLLSDLDSTNEDFANNFEKYLQKAIFQSLIANEYKDKIKELYDAWANYGKDGLSSDEAREIRDMQAQLTDSLLAEREQLMKDFGWSLSTEQQSASSKGFQTMSQDTGEELNGRFTALQIAGEEIKNQNIIQSQSLNLLTVKADALLSINTETRNIADDTRDLIAQSYLELVQISENTGAIVKPIIQIQKDMAEVKNNTSKL